MKKIALIGSTGSIGTQVLKIVRRYPQQFKIVALSANVNSSLLIEQSKEFNPEYVAIADESKFEEVRGALNCKVLCGENSLPQAAVLSCPDLVVVSVVGMCGLKSVIAAAEAGIDIALANKESLVAGGELVMNLVKQKKINLYPIDSEHSAVWQCLSAGKREDVKRIILTASGGAYYGLQKNQLEDISPEQAIKHPNWSMGKKISVDSATMMNKGLELIEARWLFDTLSLDYIIHPQSIIHSMVEFADGAVIAQMGFPDMELPIQLALTYPKRLPAATPPYDFSKNLTFFKPDEEAFPLPKIAMSALKKGGNAPAIINSANEAAVSLFLNHKIGFLQIAEIVGEELEKQKITQNPNFFDIFETHKEVYNKLMMNFSK